MFHFIHILGVKRAGLLTAYQEMNLWRVPRMEVESPTLLVYELNKTTSAAKARAVDIDIQLASISDITKVHLNDTVQCFSSLISWEKKK